MSSATILNEFKGKDQYFTTCLIHRISGNSLEETYLQNLFTIKSYENIWGLRSILRVINPISLERYRWLVNDVSPPLHQLHTTDEYSVSWLFSIN